MRKVVGDRLAVVIFSKIYLMQEVAKMLDKVEIGKRIILVQLLLGQLIKTGDSAIC